MKTKWQNKVLLLNTAGEGDAGGGTGSFVAPPNTGGQGAAQTGDANNASGNSAAGGNTGTPNPGQGAAPTDWRSSLPKELQENAAIKKYTSVEALAGAYVNAQKLIGSDKIPLPGKHATEEDWKNIYSKLGLPDAVDKYDVKFKETAAVDADFVKNFKENAQAAAIAYSLVGSINMRILS